MRDFMVKIVRDTREHSGHGWQFNKTKDCEGTLEKKLDYGDYSIEGYEGDFVLEIKGSVSEFINNLFTADKDRFLRELENLSTFKHAWVVCEFTLGDISSHLNMLANSRWKKKKSFYITIDKVLGFVASLMIQYKVPILFCGPYGKNLSKKLLLKAVKYSN